MISSSSSRSTISPRCTLTRAPGAQGHHDGQHHDVHHEAHHDDQESYMAQVPPPHTHTQSGRASLHVTYKPDANFPRPYRTPPVASLTPVTDLYLCASPTSLACVLDRVRAHWMHPWLHRRAGTRGSRSPKRTMRTRRSCRRMRPRTMRRRRRSRAPAALGGGPGPPPPPPPPSLPPPPKLEMPTFDCTPPPPPPPLSARESDRPAPEGPHFAICGRG